MTPQRTAAADARHPRHLRASLGTSIAAANRWLTWVFLEPATGAFRPREVRTSLGLPLAAVCLAGLTVGVLRAGARRGHPDRSPLRRRRPGTRVAAPRPETVTLTGPGIRRDIPVGASGSYSVMVPPGTYTVTGRSPLFESGAVSCRAAAGSGGD